MTDTFLRGELLLAQGVTDEQEGQFAGALAGLGVRADVRRVLADRGPADFDWLVLLALPLHAFLSDLGSQAVQDLHSRVKALLSRTPQERGRGPGEDAAPRRAERAGGRPLVLQDSAGGLRIVLEADLPVEAYRELVALDLTAYRLGPLHYDRHRGAWRSELDEAAE